ncbi:MAG: N-acyl-D-amino-acid deacylase family protein [Gammaproteobacteria bacterium]
MATYDLIVRNGLIVDGTGAPAFEGDVAISGGVIAALGSITGSATETLDAKGQLVTPGFVDIHTHYDGQATWSNRLTPSSLHGVTTAVMGNCGVGFAPCRERDHSSLIRLMEGVEDIPFPVLAEGLPWNWHSFPDYLDSMTDQHFDIDFAAQLPHAALRQYVMGERGANCEPATEQDCEQMQQLAQQAVEAGALGFSTSRTLNHRTSDGKPTPTLTASEAELTAIAQGLQQSNRGVLQVVSDFNDPQKEAAMLRRIVAHTGRPLSVSLAQSDANPDGWRLLLGAIEQAAKAGLPMRAQVAPRPIGVLLGLSLTMNPFSAHPVFSEIADHTVAQQYQALSDPVFRQRLLADIPDPNNVFGKAILRNFGKMFQLSKPLNYEPSPENTLSAIAKRSGKSPQEVALDMMLANQGHGMLYFPFLNYAQQSLDPCYEMLKSPASLPGLSDGGAHVGMICDGSFPTTLLTHWTRDRQPASSRLPLEFVVKRQSHDTARWVGLHDRGLIKAGYRADLNIIDYDRLQLDLPEIWHDLPTGGRRLMQRAEGYVATVVAGSIVYRHGEPTGQLPGRLVRGAQPAPAL